MGINDVLRRILTAASEDDAVRMAWGVIQYAEGVGVHCGYARDLSAAAVDNEAVATYGATRAHAATVALFAMDRLGWQLWPSDVEAMLAWGADGRAVPRCRLPETRIEHEVRVTRARFVGAWRLATQAALQLARRIGGRLYDVTAAAIEGRRLDGFGADGFPSAVDIAESTRIHRAQHGSSAELDALAGYANASVTYTSLPYGFRDATLFACAGVTQQEVETAEQTAVVESDKQETLRRTLLPVWECTGCALEERK